jgi:hypothetical protein
MQHKWCKDWGPSQMMPTTMAGFAQFLNKVQESHGSGGGGGVSAAATVNAPEHGADSLKEARQESAKVETKASASQTIHRFSEGPGAPNESFLSDADGNRSIAKAIGRT